VLSSLRYVLHRLVSLGGILDDILGGIPIFLVVFLVTITTTAIIATEYCSCYMALGLYVW
jgi:hypothetical protein